MTEDSSNGEVQIQLVKYAVYIISRTKTVKHCVYPCHYTIVCTLAIHHTNGATQQQEKTTVHDTAI